MIALALAAAVAFPDREGHAVVDAAHVLPAEGARQLNNRIVAWDKATGHQLVVATIPTLNGEAIEDYGYKLGREWALGRKGVNDGVILLVAPTEHKVRIEVGYGLEPTLTDALTHEILSGSVTPKLKQGDMMGAVTAGADEIMASAKTDAVQDSRAVPHGGGAWLLGLLGLLGLGGIGGWIAWARNKRIRAERKSYVASVLPRQQIDVPMPPVVPPRRVSAPYPPSVKYFPSRMPYDPPRRAPSPPAIVPVFVPSPPPPSSSYDSSSSSSSSDSSSSSWSSFDSGGGSFGGGGSSDSW